MQGAAIKALRLATMAAKLREKEAVKRSCSDHLLVKDLQISIEKLQLQLRNKPRAARKRRGGDKS